MESSIAVVLNEACYGEETLLLAMKSGEKLTIELRALIPWREV